MKNTPERTQGSHWFQWNFQIFLGLFLSSTTTTTWPWLTASQSSMTYTSWAICQPRTSSPLPKIRSLDTEFKMKWSQTTDVRLLLLHLLNSMTSNTQHYLLSTNKRTSRKNCTDCQTLVDKGDRSTQNAAWLQKHPLDVGRSPTQLFLGRRLKTMLPTTSKLLQPGQEVPKSSTAKWSIVKRNWKLPPTPPIGIWSWRFHVWNSASPR